MLVSQKTIGTLAPQYCLSEWEANRASKTASHEMRVESRAKLVGIGFMAGRVVGVISCNLVLRIRLTVRPRAPTTKERMMGEETGLEQLQDKYKELEQWLQVMIKVMKRFQDNLALVVKLEKELSEELDGMRTYLTNSLKEIGANAKAQETYTIK